MLIEFHMIQNHSPANLNRDDLGAPKTCLFGGVTRARISSQCLKRSIRRGPEFQRALEADGGVRTKRLIPIISERAAGQASEAATALVAKAFEKGGAKSEGDAPMTKVLLYVPESTIASMVDAVRAELAKPKTQQRPEALADALAACLGEGGLAPDMALCGRMTELDADGLFRRIDFRVEAALAAAHAISTHEVINEVDYFTAVDDLATDAGAGHVSEAMFASACFYKHFCIDWGTLVDNLKGNTGLASTTVRHFLRSAALSTPSGKQKSFAAFNPPEGILAEIKTERTTPISYANAFAMPVVPNADRGLIEQSVDRLGQHVHEMAEGYGIPAERFWFSPGGRHPLVWRDRHAEREALQEKPVVPTEAVFGEFVDRVMAAVEAGVALGAGR